MHCDNSWGKIYNQFKQEQKETTGGVKEWFFINPYDMQKQFRPKEKHWKQVLRKQDIQINQNASSGKDVLTISCIIFGKVEVAEVPAHFIAEYPANDTRLVYSHAMQRMVESFITFNDYIIERCINEAVIYHPCDELKFSIDINS